MFLIKVTKLNGAELVVNADLIEMIEANPDTVISLTSGRKIVVKEDADSIIDKVIRYKREIDEGFKEICSRNEVR
ncbi:MULTISPECIES: flagellar FlbD family protein [unclassified Candidatus Frackibacter]|uniref:flagellar FlbD family protein n=1 Tax=unclassified Candidatus Frackibacter TaxID=2648818 RepID=UPI00079AE03B|nr:MULTISPECIES: flagellar FlbD family protein [unclassified Candidatus Frackibacter]KXS45234.1 MAG: flagellar FlbD family protein [Candidatus Frackibacter sp. T328-2]